MAQFRSCVTAAAALSLAPFMGIGSAAAEPSSNLSFDSGIDRPPDLLFKEFKYGSSGRDRAAMVSSKMPGRPPVAIFIPSHAAVSENQRYDIGWLPSLLFDHGIASAGILWRGDQGMAASEYVARMAQAVGEITRRAETAGFDSSRLLLVGRGWGGQVAALLATDPRHLEKAGVNFGSVRAALIFDGAGFDLPKHIASSSSFRSKQLRKMVGADPAESLSPAHQTAAPNAAHFLFVTVEGDAGSSAEAEAIVAELRQSGSDATVTPIARTKWNAPATYIGHPKSPDTKTLVGFFSKSLQTPTAERP